MEKTQKLNEKQIDEEKESDEEIYQFDEFDKYTYVCYLDILGFKDLIDSQSNHNDCSVASFGKILLRIKLLGDVIDYYLSKKKLEIKKLMLSDSIYLFFNKGNFEQVLFIIGMISVYGIRSNLFYRGAIASTEMVNTKKTQQGLFLGKGIIDSYIMESTLSRYSRVVVDKKISHDYIFRDVDGINTIDIFRYIRLKYPKISNYFNNSIKELKPFSECVNCIQNTNNECLKEIYPKKLPINYQDLHPELVSIVDELICKHIANKKILSKYYDLRRIMGKV